MEELVIPYTLPLPGRGGIPAGAFRRGGSYGRVVSFAKEAHRAWKKKKDRNVRREGGGGDQLHSRAFFACYGKKGR